MDGQYRDSGSLAASGRFKPFDIRGKTRWSFVAVWTATGTPVGDIKFEVSNFNGEAVRPDGTLHPDFTASCAPLASVPAAWAAQQPGAGPTKAEFGGADQGARWIVPIYVRGSGGAGSTITIDGHSKP
jgi:hypothetical protein